MGNWGSVRSTRRLARIGSSAVRTSRVSGRCGQGLECANRNCPQIRTGKPPERHALPKDVPTTWLRATAKLEARRAADPQPPPVARSGPGFPPRRGRRGRRGSPDAGVAGVGGSNAALIMDLVVHPVAEENLLATGQPQQRRRLPHKCILSASRMCRASRV